MRLRTGGPQGDLDRARCDLVITVETSEQHSADRAGAHFDALALFPEHLGPVLAPSLANRIALRTPADLGRHTFLQSNTRLNAWPMWASAYGWVLPPLTGTVFEHYYFTLQAAVVGLGVCVVPWHLVADDVQAGRLLAPLGFRESGYRYVAKRRPHRN